MTELPFELFVAVRYLLAKRKQAFISLISLISTLGVMVGVMALLIALALMTGLQGELRDRIVGSSAHIFVFKVGGAGIENFEEDIAKLKRVPHVIGAAPAILGQGMIIGGTQTGFVTIKGIIPDYEVQVTELAKSMQTGSLDALNPVEGRPPGIIIGRELATKLGTFVGDDVHLMTPEGGVVTPFGLHATQRPYRIVGLFNLGLYEFDAVPGARMACQKFGATRAAFCLELLEEAGHLDWIVPRARHDPCAERIRLTLRIARVFQQNRIRA